MNTILEPQSIKITLVLYHGKEEIHSEIVNYLWIEVVQSNKYYKSCAVSVTSEVGLTTNRDLSLLTCWKNMTSFIPPRYQKSCDASHYTTLRSVDMPLKSISKSFNTNQLGGILVV